MSPGLQSNGAGRFARPTGARAAAALALAVALAACNSGPDCLKSTGPVVTQRRAVARGLGEVHLYDNVDLQLVQDTATYAEVTAGEHLIDGVTFTRKGPILEIANTSTCNWVRSYDTPHVVKLHVPRVRSLFLMGFGNISTVGEFRQDSIFCHLTQNGDYDLALRAQRVYVDQFGLGDVYLRGTTDELNVTLGGGGRLFAQNMPAQRVFFNTGAASLGDLHVRSANFVGGTLRGTGNLYYSGAPAVLDVKRTGPGQGYAE